MLQVVLAGECLTNSKADSSHPVTTPSLSLSNPHCLAGQALLCVCVSGRSGHHISVSVLFCMLSCTVKRKLFDQHYLWCCQAGPLVHLTCHQQVFDQALKEQHNVCVCQHDAMGCLGLICAGATWSVDTGTTIISILAKTWQATHAVHRPHYVVSG